MEKTMSDGFLEFSADDTTAGFRLIRMELYNWGTFNNRIWSLPLKGRNGLLTGDIGSGKSTVVDAVTTLLVPAHRVAYNKAAGADYRERSLRSYVLGYYKSERSDGGFSAKPVALRKEGTFHSVILGVFHNEGYNQTVTLAQVFRQKDHTGQPDRFYVVGDTPMSIREHFSDFGNDINALRRRLRGLEYTELHDSFPPYGAAFRRRFGIKNEQALELFHQTVSLKAVGNLTSFVREHMLEAFDAGTGIENLIQHFEDLNTAHDAILRAKAQIAALTPLVESLDRHQETQLELETLTAARNGLQAYFANLKKRFLEERIGQEELKAEKLALRREACKERLSELKSDRDEIKQAIAVNGGDRLETLKSEARRVSAEKDKRIGKAGDYNNLARSLELPELKDSGVFTDNRSRLEELLSDTDARKGEHSNRHSDVEYAFRGLQDEHAELAAEIASLKRRKSNIASRQIDIRTRLCQDLDIEEERLPFAGELMAVREDETAWEGAAERVLRNFGLSLLVPEDLYAQVLQWVDETGLKGRLVYYRVGSFKAVPHQPHGAQSLINKISLKKDSSHHDWLKDQLIRRFDFSCCKTLEEFRRSGKGLTRAGQIKGSSLRHEKDDRHDIDDRSRYVLGWTNQVKISALEKRRDKLEHSIADRGTELAGLQKKMTALEERGDRIKELRYFTVFDDLDWKPLALRLDELSAEINTLENRSDLLKSLQERLRSVETDIAETENSLDEIKRGIATIEAKIEGHREAALREEEILASVETAPEDVSALIDPFLKKHLPDRKLYLETCPKAESDLRSELQTFIDSGRKRLDRLLQSIISTMETFRRDYPSETRDMDAAIEAGGEYRNFLGRLTRDNLPRFEAQFKTLLNENTIREIAGFQAQLNTEVQKIKEKIDRINKSLSEIEYNKDRYIYLEAINTNDPEIRDFRQELKACIEGAFTGGGDEQYTEAKFLQVKEIVDRFKGREGRSDSDSRWTNKVTDVRNWFVFAASERWFEDGSEYEHYTDSGGKSGGQKEKLAYTVLAASLAYQFGLEWGEVRSRSFRFVMIDEAFGRGSDESAQYGLELFRKLNLQLLIITPLQKIHIIEPYVSTVGFVSNEEGQNSLLRCLTIEEYRDEKAAKKS